MLRVLSLGAGVQSTTMALMAAHGEFGDMPDCAIFADTGWEPKGVYEHLEWLIPQLPFPVHIVSQGNIRDDTMNSQNSTGQRFASIPFFLEGGGLGRRQCTSEYKIKPIHRKVRELLGGKTPKGGCEMWIGISTDEAVRMKPSRVQYIVNRWPLIEARISRSNCYAWMERHGYPKPAKSSCIGCPYHSDAIWRDMKNNDPESWADAVQFDKALRDNNQSQFKNAQYLHRSCKPLDEAPLNDPKEIGQGDLFGEECEGMCGV